jgi:hypothetical protein
LGASEAGAGSVTATLKIRSVLIAVLGLDICPIRAHCAV